jgi:non-ribosomal peptide synthetase component F
MSPKIEQLAMNGIITNNNANTSYSEDITITGLFEKNVVLHPETIAIKHTKGLISYRELNIQANKLAHYLSEFAVAPESLIAVSLEHAHEFIIAILAILKIGAAYVPLDVRYPKSRLQLMLKDTQATFLITSSKLVKCFGKYKGTIIKLDKIAKSLEKRSCANPNINVLSNNLAYVMYTSGSTGKPKGIMIEHKSVVRLVKDTNYIQITNRDVIAQASNVSFDASTFEIWGALLNGATLRIVPKEILLSIDKFVQFLTHL